jgi:galactokinase
MTIAAPAVDALRALVPDASTTRVVRAPGRVNLIGEHTDYNEGFVLPMAIDREIVIAAAPSGDRRVELTRLDTGEREGFELDAIPAARGIWIDYVAGVASVLAEREVPMRGLRGVVASTLPIAVGLSSSAAVEMAAAWALVADDEPPLGPIELARVGQAVENGYIGVNSGLMDQLASVLGKRDAALLIDCRSLEWWPVQLPLEQHCVVAIESGSPRRLGASAYNERRSECESVVQALRERNPSVRAMRDVDLDALAAAADVVGPMAARRAEHVIRENRRVLDCVAALERGDLETVGELLASSHASLRDLFEVSSPELDALVDIATGVPGVVGARMTGGGFGGSIVVLAERGAVARLRGSVAQAYRDRTGLEAAVHVVEPADGAGRVHAGAYEPP